MVLGKMLGLNLFTDEFGNCRPKPFGIYQHLFDECDIVYVQRDADFYFLWHKYKRCVAEAEKCESKELDLNMRVSYGVLTDQDKYRFKTKYWHRYCCMWQKLGDKIKEKLDQMKEEFR